MPQGIDGPIDSATRCLVQSHVPQAWVREAFAYGRAEPADLEGAREVTMHWAAHVPRPKPGESPEFHGIIEFPAITTFGNFRYCDH